MLDFDYSIDTKIFFGRGKAAVIGGQIRQYAGKVLLVYGQGSIKRIGVYDEVRGLLERAGIACAELADVVPNPRIASVREGVRLCREQGCGFVLAVGGGSVIDCAKAIAAGFYYDGDPWDFFGKRVPIERALPLAAVLTISGTGSEMNGFAVITNDETKEKLPAGADILRPRFSVLDPTYTFSVSPVQTASGVVDIFMHVLEQYFSAETACAVQDRLSEGILKTVLDYGPMAVREPFNYDARSNIMWASSLALNGLLSYGKTGDWSTHYIEHAVSALYDVTHGAGLAILLPHWMDYVLSEETVETLAMYARNVWAHEDEDGFAAAQAGIDLTRQFFASLGMPSRLRDVGVEQGSLEEIADKATSFGDIGTFRVLGREDVRAILEAAW